MRPRILSLLLAGLLLAGCRTSGPPVPPPPSPLEAMARGKAWLLSHQNPDGSWGDFGHCHVDELYLGTVAAHQAFGDASTALCAMALMALPESPDGRAALERSLDFLAGREPALRQTGDALYNVWANTYVLQCLARAMQDARFSDRRERLGNAARRQLDALTAFQSAMGGWGYYDFGYNLRRASGFLATSFGTAATLVALAEARDAGLELPPGMAEEALKFLVWHRNPDGSYVYGFYAWERPAHPYNQVKGSLSRMQAAACALHRFGPADPGSLKTALDLFFQHHHFLEMGRQRQYPHESWYLVAGYYYYFGHLYAAMNVAALPPAERGPYAARLAGILASTQEPDGSWWDFPMYRYSKAYGTGLALLALATLHTP